MCAVTVPPPPTESVDRVDWDVNASLSVNNGGSTLLVISTKLTPIFSCGQAGVKGQTAEGSTSFSRANVFIVSTDVEFNFRRVPYSSRYVVSIKMHEVQIIET